MSIGALAQDLLLIDTMPFRISVDTGGTLTDVVVADPAGRHTIGKALTTPERIFRGMRAEIEAAAEELGLPAATLLRETDALIYGTTRATNAVMSKSTAKTAFLTTKGFADTLVLREGGKFNPNDYSLDYPDRYIPRRYTFEIDDGDPLTRDPERVRHDVEEGWETAERAATIYGVILSGRGEDDSLAVDIAATARQRALLARQASTREAGHAELLSS